MPGLVPRTRNLKTPVMARMAEERRLGPWALALGAQGVLLGLAALIGIARPLFFAEAPVFQAVRGGESPEQQLARELLTSHSARLAGGGPLPMLRSAPALPVPEPTTAALLAERQSAALETLAQGLLRSQALLESPSAHVPVSFFGVEEEAPVIVICLDVSASVVNKARARGRDITLLREETRRLIESLPVGKSFALIQFVRAYERFRPQVARASPGAKAAAVDWLEANFVTSGRSGTGWTSGQPNGIESVLRAAFAYEPGAVFIVSDGSFQRNLPNGGSQNVPWADLERLVEELQRANPERARLHAVTLGLRPRDRAPLHSLVARSGGSWREL